MKNTTDAELKAAAVLSWLGVALVPLSSVLDWFIYPEWYLRFLVLRGAAMVLFGVILLHIRFARRKHPRICIFLLALSLTAIFSLMSNLSGEGYRSDYYIGMIEVMFGLVLVPFSTVIYVSILSAMYVMYITILHGFRPLPVDSRYFIENHVFILETIVILFFAHLYISRLRNKLRALNSQNEYFIRVFAHDIKNRLTGGFALLKISLSEPKKEYIELAYANEKEIHRMVINLLNLFSEEKISITKETIPVDALIKSFRENWELSCSARNIVFTCSKTDCTHLYADREYSELIWNNLLSNALHHTPEGGMIMVEFSREQSFTSVKFLNSGTLISESSRKDLFDKYLTPDKQSAYHKGLGLNYSRMMCSLHGGDIGYSVEKGMNAFTVRLPVAGTVPPA
jgi:signal transduction histidine kinase